MQKLIGIALLFCLLPAAALDRARFDALNQKARDLRQQQDWKGLREVLIELRKELPGATPRYLLRMASVEVHLDHKTEALRLLEQYVAMGLSYDVAKDDDLQPLLSEKGFAKIAAKMKQHTAPISRAEQVCVLPQADIMPEDIAFEPASDTFVVSSIQHHTLYRISLPAKNKSECMMEELPLPDEAKRWPLLAVSADSTRNALWTTASAMPGFSGFPKEDDGKAALLEIDPVSARVLHRFSAETGGPAVLGDMSVDHDGNVYVSDSIGGGVYRLHGSPEMAKLEKIVDGPFSPQTPALARDGQRLFVADYPIGVAVINLSAPANHQIEYLHIPDNVAATGLDGLCLSGDSLIGIQNGTEPARIVRFHLNPSQTQITSAEIIEQASGRLGEPTHAIEANGWIYVIANVGWDQVDDQGKLKPGKKFTAPVLLRFPSK